MAFASKSPWVIHYDGSSCNGCDIEVLAALCPGTRVRAVLGGTVLPCTERAPGAWEVTVPHGLKNAVVELRPE